MTHPPQPSEWSDPSSPTRPAAEPPTSQIPPAPGPPAPPSDYPPSDYPASAYPTSAYPTSGYEQPGYPPQPPAGYVPATGYAYPAGAGAPVVVSQPTNGLAIAAMILAIVGFGPIAAVMGHIARRQVRERNEQGEGFALAGIIVGWVTTGIWVLCCGAYGVALAGGLLSGNIT